MNLKALTEQLWKKKITFLVIYFVIFTVSYLILVAVDFLPEAPTDEKEQNTVTNTLMETATAIGESEVSLLGSENDAEQELRAVPQMIYIEKLDKTITVLNPESRLIADLDTALLDGVVRHPDSALLGQTGNVFILGHSSYLPNVFNPSFQAFNGIQNLKWGDIIEVTSEEGVFVYRVEKVFQARAQDVTVPIAGTEKLLTLATCNSFGSTDDRYVVEAKQIEVRSL